MVLSQISLNLRLVDLDQTLPIDVGLILEESRGQHKRILFLQKENLHKICIAMEMLKK